MKFMNLTVGETLFTVTVVLFLSNEIKNICLMRKSDEGSSTYLSSQVNESREAFTKKFHSYHERR